jgi:hypothetical protein
MCTVEPIQGTAGLGGGRGAGGIAEQRQTASLDGMQPSNAAPSAGRPASRDTSAAWPTASATAETRQGRFVGVPAVQGLDGLAVQEPHDLFTARPS